MYKNINNKIPTNVKSPYLWEIIHLKKRVKEELQEKFQNDFK